MVANRTEFNLPPKAELHRQADKPPAARELITTHAVVFLSNKGVVILEEKTGKVA